MARITQAHRLEAATALLCSTGMAVPLLAGRHVSASIWAFLAKEEAFVYKAEMAAANAARPTTPSVGVADKNCRRLANTAAATT